MGDRANVVVIADDEEREGKTAVFLYTHWNGTELPATLKLALEFGRERWNDSQYLARIIFNRMTRGREDEETGFGISTLLGDNGHPLLVVDVPNQLVIEYSEDEYNEHGFAKLPKRGASFEKYNGKWKPRR